MRNGAAPLSARQKAAVAAAYVTSRLSTCGGDGGEGGEREVGGVVPRRAKERRPAERREQRREEEGKRAGHRLDAEAEHLVLQRQQRLLHALAAAAVCYLRTRTPVAQRWAPQLAHRQPHR